MKKRPIILRILASLVLLTLAGLTLPSLTCLTCPITTHTFHNHYLLPLTLTLIALGNLWTLTLTPTHTSKNDDTQSPTTPLTPRRLGTLFPLIAAAITINPHTASATPPEPLPLEETPDLGWGSSLLTHNRDTLEVHKQHEEIDSTEIVQQTYVVNSGDTLWTITQNYLPSHATDADVAYACMRWAEVNHLTNPDLIFPQQQLTIPEEYLS